MPEYAIIKDATEVDLSRLNLDSLPSYISQCKQLKKINLSGNRKIKVLDTFHKLAQLPLLEVLIMDYCNLYFLPSEINRFKNLKVLSLEGNGIGWLPPTFKKLPLEELNLAKNNIDSLNLGFYSLLNLRKFNFSENPGVARSYNMDILASFPQLSTLFLQNAKEISKNIGKIKTLQSLDISGSSIKNLPEELAKLSRLQTLNVKGCEQLDLSTTIEYLSALKTLQNFHFAHPKFSSIPFNINKLKSLKHIYVYNASLGRLPSSFVQLKLAKMYFYHCYFTTANEFFGELSKMNSLQEIVLQDCAIHEEDVKSKKVTIAQSENDSAFVYDNTFNKVIKANVAQQPQQDYLLRTSTVFVQLKRNLKKNTFFFYLDPQYGYNEKQLQFWGDKIKAYPELKEYKGIRWDYTGHTPLEDIENIYLLSEPADLQKMKKKSTTEMYILNLEDIIITPNKAEDSYTISFSRGFDTLQLNVLPALNLSDPKKIQNWHRNRYAIYLEKRLKREEKWAELDLKYVLSYEKYELKLEAFRTTLNSKFYHEFEK